MHLQITIQIKTKQKNKLQTICPNNYYYTAKMVTLALLIAVRYSRFLKEKKIE